MSFIAILMFTTLTLALALGLYQMAKVEKELPEDESHLIPELKLQQMDAAMGKDRVRGSRKDPLRA